MPAADQLAAFLVASFLLIQIPGPSLLFTIGRALSVSRRAALLSVLGNASGLWVQATVVARGLGALVTASAAAHDVLRFGGAAYFCWLGIQTIRNRADARLALQAPGTGDAHSTAGSLGAGFVVGVTNPKTLVFFASFLPQFIAPAGAPATVQLLVLGTVFAVMGGASDGVWALLAARARDWFGRRPERLDALGVVGGVMLFGLGAFVAFSGRQAR